MSNRLVKFAPALLLAASAFVSTSASAAGITPEIGSTGAGFHIELPLRPDLAARFGAGYLSWLYQGQTSSMRYDLKLQARTADVLLDWYPATNGLRLTGGLAWNGSETVIKPSPSASGSLTINGSNYSTSDIGQLEGRADFRRLAPYLGLGWGGRDRAAKGWSVSVDVGVLMQGSPKVSLASSGCNLPSSACAQLASDLKRESDNLTALAGRYRVYPVLRVGATLRF